MRMITQNSPTRVPLEGDSSREYETIVGTSKATIVSRKLLLREHFPGFSLSWRTSSIKSTPRKTKDGFLLTRRPYPTSNSTINPANPTPTVATRGKHWLRKCGKANCLVSVVSVKESNVTILATKIWTCYYFFLYFPT